MATPVLSMASKLVNRRIRRLFIESKMEAMYWTITERSEENFWRDGADETKV